MRQLNFHLKTMVLKHLHTGSLLKTYILYLCPVKRKIVIGPKKITAINTSSKIETVKLFELRKRTAKWLHTPFFLMISIAPAGNNHR